MNHNTPIQKLQPTKGRHKTVKLHLWSRGSNANECCPKIVKKVNSFNVGHVVVPFRFGILFSNIPYDVHRVLSLQDIHVTTHMRTLSGSSAPSMDEEK